jgi:hypothetical protein
VKEGVELGDTDPEACSHVCETGCGFLPHNLTGIYKLEVPRDTQQNAMQCKETSKLNTARTVGQRLVEQKGR